MSFEYKIVPAPAQTIRARHLKTPAERIAATIEDIVNTWASEGWEYIRTDTLTVTDKAGRLSKAVTHIETMLVFRREASEAAPAKVKDDAPVFSVPKAEAAKPAEPKTAEGVETETPSEGAFIPRSGISSETAKHAPSLGGASRD